MKKETHCSKKEIKRMVAVFSQQLNAKSLLGRNEANGMNRYYFAYPTEENKSIQPYKNN
jgi:hypothetical protein